MILIREYQLMRLFLILSSLNKLIDWILLLIFMNANINKKDVDEIKADYLKGLKFTYVTQMSEVLEQALLKEKAK